MAVGAVSGSHSPKKKPQSTRDNFLVYQRQRFTLGELANSASLVLPVTHAVIVTHLPGPRTTGTASFVVTALPRSSVARTSTVRVAAPLWLRS
jgi:hypothetical protein